ncbi:regulatory protein GemA [Ferrovibrio terrae]|uniref:regulatory protein GemA n=1 Tax=Ferrovibrio terrae TaxID=2594003 RepID=UPI0031383E9F
MAADRKKLIAAIHVAKNKKGISEDDYRAMLRNEFQVASSTDLAVPQLGALLTRINGGKRFREASGKAYVRKIFAVWGEMCRQGIPDSRNRTALLAFVKRMTNKDDPEWLTPAEGNRVIEALKDWQERALAKQAEATNAAAS